MALTVSVVMAEVFDLSDLETIMLVFAISRYPCTALDAGGTTKTSCFQLYSKFQWPLMGQPRTCERPREREREKEVRKEGGQPPNYYRHELKVRNEVFERS